jgi:putative heavy-metal chelation protein
VSVLSGIVVEQASEIMRIVSEGGGMRQFKGSVCKVNRTVGGE